MTCEWKPVALGDVADTRNGAGIKQAFFSESGVPLARVSNFTDSSIDLEGCIRVASEHARRWESHRLEEGDVVVATVGSWPPNWASVVGKAVRVPRSAQGAIQNQNTCCVIARPGTTDQRFLFYQLRTREFARYAANAAAGSANQARLPVANLERYEFQLPPIEEQRRIAHILGTLDDKIELNRRMNRTLEAIARAIFKSWFVNFDPVIDNALAAGRSIPKQFAERAAGRARLTHGKSHLPENIHRLFPDEFQDSELGPIPKGWEVTKIGAVCTIINGGTPSTKIPDYWEPEEIAWATPTDITALDSSIISTTARRISKAGLENSGAKLLPAGAVLVTSRATIGYSAISSVPIATNQGFKSIVCGDAVASLFMLQVVRELQPEIINLASGSTYPEINASTFRAIRFVLPHRDLVSAYQKLANGLFRRIELNGTNKHALAGIRGSLLPWLLSGELHASGREEPT